MGERKPEWPNDDDDQLWWWRRAILSLECTTWPGNLKYKSLVTRNKISKNALLDTDWAKWRGAREAQPSSPSSVKLPQVQSRYSLVYHCFLNEFCFVKSVFFLWLILKNDASLNLYSFCFFACHYHLLSHPPPPPGLCLHGYVPSLA